MAGAAEPLKPKMRGRPPLKRVCTWCGLASTPLNYLIRTTDRMSRFCSEKCLADCRKTLVIVFCAQCKAQVKGVPVLFEVQNQPGLKFCSTGCLNMYQEGESAREKRHHERALARETRLMDESAKESESQNLGRKPSVRGPEPERREPVFNWEDYLKETKSVAAPAKCFRQSLQPPVNDFEPGMKLEAQDHRNMQSTCVATVIHKIGPRIRLRLDGGDNKNDFWRLVDSSEIKPIGHCETSGNLLQPPLGFTLNLSSWPMFLYRTLNGAHVAPTKCFKPEPPAVTTNHFVVGMKLEAVDRKNPHLICAATIGEINGDHIFVNFDGWRGAFDYWCHYNSRDIFPIGWTENSGHPLQPPPQKHAPGTRRSAVRAGLTYQLTTGTSETTSDATVSSTGEKTVQVASIFVRHSCSFGPFLDKAKVVELPLHYGPMTVPRALRFCVQSLVDAAIDPGTVLDKIPEGGGKSTVSAVIDGKAKTVRLPSIKKLPDLWTFLKTFTKTLQCCDNFLSRVSLTGECVHCKILDQPSPESSSASSTAVEVLEVVDATPKGRKRRVLRDDRRSFKNQSTGPLPVIDCVSPVLSPEQENGGTFRLDGEPEMAATPKRRHRAVSPVIQLQSMDATTPIYQRRTSVTPEKPEERLVSPQNRRVAPPVNNSKSIPISPLKEQQRKNSPVAELVIPDVIIDSPEEKPLPFDPSEWSIEHVILYLKRTDPSLAVHAATFRTHEIDGKALQLLTSDKMMRYMGVKLGPALKICHLVARIRSRRFSFSKAPTWN